MATVSQILDLLLSHYRSNGQPTAEMLAYQAPVISQWFGDRDADSLSFGDFEAYKAHRIAQGKKPKTVNNELGYLGRANRLARRAGLCRELWDFEKFKIGRRYARRGFLQPDELESIVSEMRDPDVRDLVLFLYWSGWRRGEALSIRWDWLSDLHISLPDSKNGRPRLCPLVGKVAEVIRRRRRRRHPECEYVFHRAGSPIKDFTRQWTGACDRAGLPGKLVHDMRRSFVRNAVRANVDRDVAKELSGHKTDFVFSWYNITDEDDLAGGARKIHRKFGPKNPRVNAQV